MVEYTSLKANTELFLEEYGRAADRVIRSGWYILGPELERFEKEFASYLGVKHCVGLNSGTDALILAVRALGIGPGDEVIVPAGAYIASILGVTENGATPVYVDSNEYLLMDTSALEAAVTERTKAILPVHMYGQCCDMTGIMELAEKHGLRVIEDCAQCHGSTWEGRMAGTFGDMGCYSFYPTKPLGALGDAGAICTDDDELAERARLLRNYGSREKYHNETIGRNSRLDELQAAFLSVGLSHIEETNALRLDIARRYLEEIKNPKLTLPAKDPRAHHVYHLFPVLTPDRDGFIQYMKDAGIKTQIHYPVPPYVAECYRDMFPHEWEDFPQAGRIARQEVSLPIYSAMPMEDVSEVIRAANEY